MKMRTLMLCLIVTAIVGVVSLGASAASFSGNAQDSYVSNDTIVGVINGQSVVFLKRFMERVQGYEYLRGYFDAYSADGQPLNGGLGIQIPVGMAAGDTLTNNNLSNEAKAITFEVGGQYYTSGDLSLTVDGISDDNVYEGRITFQSPFVSMTNGRFKFTVTDAN